MATNAQIAAAAIARAKAAKLKPKTTEPVKPILAQDIFINSLKPYFPNINKETPWMLATYKIASNLYGQGYSLNSLPDQVLDSDKVPQAYKDRFAGIFALRKRQAAGENVAHIPTVSEYTKLQYEIKNELNQYGLNEMASDDNVNNIIGSNVDLTQVQTRLSDAFDAIDNADPFLKAELAKNFPNVSRADTAMALLSGPEGAKALKRKVEVAGIRAAATEFGTKNSSSAEDLQSMGVSRADARAGYAKSQQEIAGLSAMQRNLGGTGDIAAELEQANILGKESSNIKQLKSQARGQFSQGRMRAGAGSTERTGQL